jgi:hypothetical protein
MSKILLVTGFLLILLTPVFAQTSYTQPMYQVEWTSTTITVNVPYEPIWAYLWFKDAIQDWNSAQAWFLANYEPGQQNMKYTLELSNSPTANVIVQYVPDQGQDWDGLTSN